jgi:hypothetical protein
MKIEIKMRKILSSGVIIVTNLIPIYGVLYWKWNIFSIMFLYWAESAIIGFFNFLMVKKIKSIIPMGKDSPFKSVRYLSVGNFIKLYGTFMLIHGILIFALFRPIYLAPLKTCFAFLFILADHAFLYVFGFLRNEDYRKTPLDKQLFMPLKRLGIMHFAVFCGGLIAKFLGAPFIALIFLVILKIFVDLFGNWIEQNII